MPCNLVAKSRYSDGPVVEKLRAGGLFYDHQDPHIVEHCHQVGHKILGGDNDHANNVFAFTESLHGLVCKQDSACKFACLTQ